MRLAGIIGIFLWMLLVVAVPRGNTRQGVELESKRKLREVPHLVSSPTRSTRHLKQNSVHHDCTRRNVDLSAYLTTIAHNIVEPQHNYVTHPLTGESFQSSNGPPESTSEESLLAIEKAARVGKNVPRKESENDFVRIASKQSVLDHTFIQIRKPGRGSPITQKVFNDGALMGQFNRCITTEAAASDADTSPTCYLDDEYNDRLTFQITFRSSASAIQSAFEANPPSLKVLGGDTNIALPSILNTSVQISNSEAVVTVGYGCKENVSGTLFLQLNLHFGSGEENSTAIRWQKRCEGGFNDKIDFGYLLNEKGNSEPSRHEFSSQLLALNVVPGDESTEVFMKVQQPGARQEFLRPYVISNNPDVTSVMLRGNHPSGGVLQGLEETSLQITYDCAKKGTSNVTLAVGIPPFNNLTATWRKDCGGQVATRLQVGTTEVGQDIVADGIPQPQFAVDIDRIGSPHSEEHLHLPGNQSDWITYMTNSEIEGPAAREASLHIGRITLTVEHPEIVAALPPRINSKSLTGWGERKTAEQILLPGESLRVSFHFVCRGLGESRILVTVPVLHYDTMEFGFAKHCTHIATAHRSREIVWTVGNVLWIVTLISLGTALWCWRRTKQAAKGFQHLPNTG